jgi:hypothetical protein
VNVTPEGRKRLADLMEERRLALGPLEWREVAQRGGLSYEAIRALRAGDAGDPTPVTLAKVDRGLEWVPGSAARVLYEGGEPEDILSPEERRALLIYPRSVAEGIARREGEHRNGATG